MDEKIIIRNQSSADWDTALKAVSHVIKQGRISNAGQHYCYMSTFKISDPDGSELYIAVSVDKNRKSDRFIVWNYFDVPESIHNQGVEK